MFLKRLTDKKPITVDYYTNGSIKKIKGCVHSLNLKEQILSLKDEKQKFITIQLSGIRHIQ